MSPLTRFFLAFLTNALLGASTVQGQDGATPLVFEGTLLSSDGGPVPGAQIQFWQTDRFGRYNHPGDLQDGAALDPAFQYFGTETTGEDGRFAFRTIRPGKYAYRPPHIHFKVWQTTADGTRENTLTSQWYFADDATAAGQPDALKLEVEEEEVGPGGGAVTLRTGKTITVATGGPSGTGTGCPRRNRTDGSERVGRRTRTSLRRCPRTSLGPSDLSHRFQDGARYRGNTNRLCNFRIH